MNAEPLGENPDEEVVDLEMTFARMYWRHRLHTNDASLKEAVRKVGPLLPDVRRYLATHPYRPRHYHHHHADHEEARHAA